MRTVIAVLLLAGCSGPSFSAEQGGGAGGVAGNAGGFAGSSGTALVGGMGGATDGGTDAPGEAAGGYAGTEGGTDAEDAAEDTAPDADPFTGCECNGPNELCPDQQNHCQAVPDKHSCCACPVTAQLPTNLCDYFPGTGLWCCL